MHTQAYVRTPMARLKVNRFDPLSPSRARTLSLSLEDTHAHAAFVVATRTVEAAQYEDDSQQSGVTACDDVLETLRQLVVPLHTALIRRQQHQSVSASAGQYQAMNITMDMFGGAAPVYELQLCLHMRSPLCGTRNKYVNSSLLYCHPVKMDRGCTAGSATPARETKRIAVV